tara:strand:+ start:231 stop:548 length:318 start_codon:yes stop_codon:yes gene_type:complete
LESLNHSFSSSSLLLNIWISSLLAIHHLTSYQAKAKALHTATVSSFSKAFSFHNCQNELQVNVHFFVLIVALNIATSHSNEKCVSIDISLSWSEWNLSTLSCTDI